MTGSPRSGAWRTMSRKKSSGCWRRIIRRKSGWRRCAAREVTCRHRSTTDVSNRRFWQFRRLWQCESTRSYFRSFFLQPRQLAHEEKQVAHVDAPCRQVAAPEIRDRIDVTWRGKEHCRYKHQAGGATRGPLHVGGVDFLRGPLHLIAEPGNQRSKAEEGDHVDEQDILHPGIQVRCADHRRGMVGAEP